MNQKREISLKEIWEELENSKVIDPEIGEAALSHYLHNFKYDYSLGLKKAAITHLKNVLQNWSDRLAQDSIKNPNREHELLLLPGEKVSEKKAAQILKRLVAGFKNRVSFRAPTKPKFTFIDLFAGIGGFRIAMQSLGGRCVYSSEWDKKARETYRTNFGEIPFGDITTKETKKFIPKDFDVLCAGFPCQAFSIAGRKGGFEDTRGTLFFEVAKIIKSKRPKALFLENVKGLFNHDRGRTLSTILNVLREELNYYIPDPEVMNAKDFGVPQNRERIFIVGFRKDLGIKSFRYPNARKKKTTYRSIKEEKPVSVKYYLSNRYLDTLRKHRARHESKGNGFGYEIIPAHGTANAVVCGGMGRERNLVLDNRLKDYTPVTHIKGQVNREGIRRMTPREWARLQGFPDKFSIPVADASAYKQFGNSVAVPAIKATAKRVIDMLSS